MANIYTIETQGHRLKFQADSEQEAMDAASSWTPPTQTETPVTATGLGKAAVGGLAQGTTSLMGLVPDLGDLLNRGVNKGMEAVGMQPPPLAPNFWGSQAIQKGVEKYITGDFHKPENTAEKYVQTAASFVPGTLAAPGGMVSNAVRYGIGPGLASEAAGQAVGEGSKYEPYARAAAGVSAGLLNPERLVTPFPASPARLADIGVLKNEGVTSLTAGQRTGNENLRYLEDAASKATFAGQGARRLEHEAQNQFTEAATGRAGIQGLSTPENLAANQKRLVGTNDEGGVVQDLAKRSTLIPDNKMINDLVDTVKGYRNVPESAQRAKIQGYVDDIVGHINNGQMPGEAYQKMRSRLSRESKSFAASDPDMSEALGGMKSALDSAMARSVGPELGKEWAQFRKEYGAQKVLEKAASRAGEATLEGNITPANLRNIIAAENRGGYARGSGPFNELARAGAAVMTPLPNSGTAQRMGAIQTLDNALIALPRAVAGRVVMNPLIQELLGNQALVGNLPKNSAAQQLLLAQMLQRASPYTGPNLGPLQKGQ